MDGAATGTMRIRIFNQPGAHQDQTTKGPGDQGPHHHTQRNDDADEGERGINRLASNHKLALSYTHAMIGEVGGKEKKSGLALSAS